jgi:hypothetical protein
MVDTGTMNARAISSVVRLKTRRFRIRHRHLLLDKGLAAQLFVFAVEPLVAAQAIDRTVLRGGHEPGARVVRDT